MNIEKALADRIGPAGAKLHSARSRNDQVALDLKLYLRDQCDLLVELLDTVRRGFAQLARTYLGAIMPGYTHMQRAQPVLVSHHLLAYFEMFSRDRERLLDCRKRINICPLGGAAMAGTGLPIERQQVAADAVGQAGLGLPGEPLELHRLAARLGCHLDRDDRGEQRGVPAGGDG